MDLFIDENIEAPEDISAFAVVIASHGAWEPLEIRTKRPTADAIAAVLDVNGSDAHSIAIRVMDTASEAGLADGLVALEELAVETATKRQIGGVSGMPRLAKFTLAIDILRNLRILQGSQYVDMISV